MCVVLAHKDESLSKFKDSQMNTQAHMKYNSTHEMPQLRPPLEAPS